MNRVAMIVIFVGMTYLFFAIDPILGAIFLLMWPAWYLFHRKELE